MRPIRLTMSAFGPYAGKEMVDFSLLGENCLFLICGPTGAGKSTILDAMCYALYGRTSGDMRSGANLRSDYADAETLTTVTFDFAVGETRYRITRTPEQMRASRRKNADKLVLQKMESALYEIDEDGGEIRLIAAKETEKKASELLGVEVAQFRQIILLPQGDFRRLLLASSGERQTIMQQLFHTGLYLSLERRLFDRVSALSKAYQMGKTRMETLLSACGAASAEDLAGQQAQAAEEIKTAEAALTAAEAARTAFQKSYDEAQALDGTWQRWLAARGDTERLGRQAGDMAALAERIERISAAARLKDAKDHLEETLQEGSRQSRKQREIDAALAAITARKTQAEKDWAASEAEVPRQKERTDAIVRLTALQEPAARYGEARAAAEKEQELYKRAAAAQKQAGAALTAAEAVLAEAKKKANAYETAFLHGQAAYLASRLTDGAPCPVCGSVEHPAPACSEEALPDERDVKAAKDSAQAAERKAERCRTDVAKAAETESRVRAAQTAAASALTALESQLPPDVRDPQRLAAQIRALTAEAAAFDARRKAIQTLLQKVQSDEAAAVKERNLLAARVEELRAQYTTDRETLLARAQEAGFKDIEEFTPYFQDAPKEASLRKQHNDYLAAVKAAADRTAAEEKNIAGRPRPDMAAWNRERAEKDGAVKAALTEKNRIEGRISLLENTGKELAALEKAQGDLADRYKLAGGLHALFSGKASGVNLERFVLGALLDDVTRKANVRLKVMSGGRYELSRRQGRDDRRSLGGLDLDVFDSYTGHARPASTLSGGETFLASLSLALGLADVVQEYAGGIHLDAMFIDEGFGTLDAESLDLALRTLTKLQSTSRLVGIISHVSELEERIPAKLRITKTDRGSRARFEIGE